MPGVSEGGKKGLKTRRKRPKIARIRPKLPRKRAEIGRKLPELPVKKDWERVRSGANFGNEDEAKRCVGRRSVPRPAPLVPLRSKLASV